MDHDDEPTPLVPAERHADLAVDRSPGTDHIRACPNCREWRHRSEFPAGRRYCRAPACQRQEGLALVDAARRATDARRLAVAAELGILLEEPKPPQVKPLAWRIVHRAALGTSEEAIAAEMGLKPGRVKHELEVAMHQLHAIARERLGVQA